MLVVSYIRVSSKGQIDGDGPERQRESIARFCTAHKLNLIYEAFESVSGTTDAMEREAFSEMIELIDIRKCSTPIEAVVVERMDRLARDLIVSEVLLTELRKRGVKVFCADQGVLLDVASNDCDPTRKLLRQLMGAIAEWEKTQLVMKLRVARQRARDAGGPPEGNPPYGSRPGESPVLELIQKWHASGWSPNEIAKELNEGGFRTRRDTEWNRESVRSLLRNHKAKVTV